MKKNIILICLFTLYSFTMLASTIIVSGAGTANANGAYENHSSTPSDQFFTVFDCDGNPDTNKSYQIIKSGGKWLIKNESGQTLYENNANSALPPSNGWVAVAPTAGAAPTLSGNTTALPEIVSIVRQNPSSEQITQSTATFRITFDKAVDNVDATDFTTNSTGASIGTVTSISTSVYDVTVNNITTGGDVFLQVKGINGVAGTNNITFTSPVISTNTTVNQQNTDDFLNQSVIGQTFASKKSGTIKSVTFYTQPGSHTFSGTAKLKLYRGDRYDFTNGPLKGGVEIDSETVTITNSTDNAGQTFSFATPVNIIPFNLYTITLEDFDGSGDRGFQVLQSNGYPNGHVIFSGMNSSFVSWDLKIKIIEGYTTGTENLALANKVPATNEKYTFIDTKPAVTTTDASAITKNSTTLGGNISTDNGFAVTERGVLYSTANQTPEIGGANVIKDINGSGTGVFSKNYTGLQRNTTYYYRAYATSSEGTGYGAIKSFTTLNPAEVLSIVRKTPTEASTNASDVTFRVTFSKKVINVTTDDFLLEGTATGTINSVSKVNDSTYDVTITNITNSGILSLHIKGVNGKSGSNDIIGELDTFTDVNTVNQNQTNDYLDQSKIGQSFKATTSNLLTRVTFFPKSGDHDFSGKADLKVFSGVEGTLLSTQEIIVKDTTPTTGQTFIFKNPKKLVQGDTYSITLSNFREGTGSHAFESNTSDVYTDGRVIFTGMNSGDHLKFDLKIKIYEGVFDTGANLTATAPVTQESYTILPLARITTNTANNITSTSATLVGDVTDENGSAVTERGFVFSTVDVSPEIGETNVFKVTDEANGVGNFTEDITDLTGQTTYHYRAYAINSSGTSYGEIKTFTTKITAAAGTMTFGTGASERIVDNQSGLNAPYTKSNFLNGFNITGDSKDRLGGLNGYVDAHLAASNFNNPTVNALFDDPNDRVLYILTSSIEGGSNLQFIKFSPYDGSEFGLSSFKFVFNSTDSFIIAGYKDGIKVGTLDVSVTTNVATTIDFTTPTTGSFKNIDEFQLIFDRQFSREDRIAFDDIVILSVPKLPVIETNTVSNITETTANLQANAKANNGSAITERGFVYSESNTNLEINTTGVTKVVHENTGKGKFSKTINNLIKESTYYYRAYATNGDGTGYGEIKSFTTFGAKPTIATKTAVSITNNSAILGGEITSEGDSGVTERGIIYSTTNSLPKIGKTGVTKVADANTGIGVFSNTITALDTKNIYYYRSYAINSQGTAYGKVKRFTLNNALLFSPGRNNNIRIPDNSTFDFSNGFTIEAWIQPTSFNRFLFSKENGGVIRTFSMEIKDNGTIEYGISIDGANYNTFTTDVIQKLTLNQWNHVAFTYNGSADPNNTASKMVAYINGVHVGENALTGALSSNSTSIFLGKNRINFRYFEGKMDEVRIWGRGLSATEVKTGMNKSVPKNAKGLIAYYPINEGIAGGDNTAITHITDVVNNYNGSLFGFLKTGPTSNFTSGVSGASIKLTEIAPNKFAITGNWSDPTKWSLGIVPNKIDRAVIGANQTVTIDVDDLEIDEFELEANATLDIPKNKELVVNKEFVSNGNLALASDTNDSGVLFVEGTTSGTITYKRGGLKANKWSIVTPPVSGQTVKSFAENVANDIRKNNAVSPVRYAIGYYNDAQSDGNKWQYFDANVNGTDTFTAGQSYAISRATDGEVSFTGTLQTGNLFKSVSGDKWNAIGNPFTTYFPANKNGSSSFLSDNASNLDIEGLYIWDEAQNKYVVYTDLVSSGERSLPPGQGFFVKTKAGTSELTFRRDKRTSKPSTGTSTFAKGNSNTPFVKLHVSDGTNKVTTDIIYDANATNGFDANLDIENFNGSNFDAYTRLVNAGSDVNFAIQSVNKSTMEAIQIPIGIKAKAGTELTFTLDAYHFADDMHIYLEDVVTNTITTLNKSKATYTLTLTNDSNGIGRFYVRATSSVLSVESNNTLTGVTMHVANNSLIIKGITATSNQVVVYNLLGKQVLNKRFSSTGNTSIALPKLTSGIYIVKLDSKEGTLRKKILIE